MVDELALNLLPYKTICDYRSECADRIHWIGGPNGVVGITHKGGGALWLGGTQWVGGAHGVRGAHGVGSAHGVGDILVVGVTHVIGGAHGVGGAHSSGVTRGGARGL